ncbi:hypothetical protein ABT354_35225 [Streptomyces sp. NPDC000594]|uniref:hypothetical protein n=1 Tax=Streptomyces sp. NPDC000594 TaxID=3154261 RepID=UPI00332F74C6
MRVSVAVVTGALAATALAVPAAQATDNPAPRFAAEGFAAQADDIHEGDTRITGVTLNGGKPIVLGTTAKKSVDVTITATDNKGIDIGSAFLWRGKSVGDADDGFVTDPEIVKCTNQGTKGTCKLKFVFNPQELYLNSIAGSWKLAVLADAKDEGENDDFAMSTKYLTTNIQRASKLTVNASPEPARQGDTLTVTGALTRANWETGTYTGYTAQPVKLQYRAKNATSYTTLKTVKTDSKGNLKTTVKATADGYYRYFFEGTPTTPAIKAGGDFVDIG